MGCSLCLNKKIWAKQPQLFFLSSQYTTFLSGFIEIFVCFFLFFFLPSLSYKNSVQTSWFCAILKKKKKKKSTRQNRTKGKHNMEVILISPWDKLLELHILLQFRLSAVRKTNNSKILQDWGLTQQGFKVPEHFST